MIAPIINSLPLTVILACLTMNLIFFQPVSVLAISTNAFFALVLIFPVLGSKIISFQALVAFLALPLNPFRLETVELRFWPPFWTFAIASLISLPVKP